MIEIVCHLPGNETKRKSFNPIGKNQFFLSSSFFSPSSMTGTSVVSCCHVLRSLSVFSVSRCWCCPSLSGSRNNRSLRLQLLLYSGCCDKIKSRDVRSLLEDNWRYNVPHILRLFICFIFFFPPSFCCRRHRHHLNAHSCPYNITLSFLRLTQHICLLCCLFPRQKPPPILSLTHHWIVRDSVRWFMDAHCGLKHTKTEISFSRLECRRRNEPDDAKRVPVAICFGIGNFPKTVRGFLL